MIFSGLGRRILAALGMTGSKFVNRTSPQASAPDMDASYTPPAATPPPGLSDHRPEPDAAGEPSAATSRSLEVDDFVAAVRHLPLFSGTATQLIRSVGDDAMSSRDLGRMISTDASLVAHLLRIVNSPYYGLPQRVGTVADALSVLGFDQVRRTITAAVLQRPLMSYLHDTAVVRAFWRHELMCAALARHIAMQKGHDGELAYMAGLMHDVGRLAMVMQYPQHADVLLGTGGADARLGIDREYALFSFDHAQVGGALLELWGLPAKIAQAAFTHADESEPPDPIGSCVWRANLLSHEMGVADDDDLVQPWMAGIELTAEERRRIGAEIRALESGQG